MRNLGTRVLLGAMLFSRVASAQTDRALAAREVLFDQAQAARASGDHLRAWELGTRALASAPDGTLRIFVIEEGLAAGRIVAALAEASRCNSDEREVPTLRERCGVLLTRARERVARVIVHAPNAPPGLSITLAGETLATTLLGAPVPTDPSNAIPWEASAPGRSTQRGTLTAVEGATVELTVSLPIDPQNQRVSPVQPPVQTQLNVAPLVTMGVGGGLLLTAAGFFLARNEQYLRCSEVTSVLYCPDNATRDALVGYTVTINVALGLGGAAVLGGFLWLRFSGTTLTRRPPEGLGLRFDQRGLVLQGRF